MKKLKTQQRASRSAAPRGSLQHSSGVVAFVVCRDPTAHAELIDLCALWHRRKKNSMYIDGEQSLSSYQANATDDRTGTR